MFSAKALASVVHAHSIRLIVVLCLALVPQFAWSQSTGTGSGQSSEDPPPVWYWPGISGPAEIAGEPSEPQAFFCRVPFATGGSEPFCAGEIGFGSTTSFDVASGSTMLTFHLRTHETVSLRSDGENLMSARLLDAFGEVVASGGLGAGTSLVRTLAPGRYYLEITGSGGISRRSSLRFARTTPLTWTGSRTTSDLTQEIGNHCGRAAAISTTATVESSFERGGDIDVFELHLERSGELLIDVDARYELKAADCAISLGVADASLGATLTPLETGTYFLYVSRNDGSEAEYELRTELR